MAINQVNKNNHNKATEQKLNNKDKQNYSMVYYHQLMLMENKVLSLVFQKKIVKNLYLSKFNPNIMTEKMCNIIFNLIINS